MYEIQNCIICGRKALESESDFSPWLAKRINVPNLSNVKSLFCESCNFVFFNKRLTDDEVKHLYTEYRGAKYNETRIEFEPGYSNIAAEFSNRDSDYWNNRIEEYSKIIDALLARNPKSILDWGGDGFVPGVLFPSELIHVSDPSVNERGKITLRKYEMIFACEVFEHLSDPVKNLRNLKNRLSKNGFIFLGVPKEFQDPIKISWNRSKKRQTCLHFMHEHINHFSMRSLKALAMAANLKIHSTITTKRNYQIIILTLNENKQSSSRLLNNNLEFQTNYLISNYYN